MMEFRKHVCCGPSPFQFRPPPSHLSAWRETGTWEFACKTLPLPLPHSALSGSERTSRFALKRLKGGFWRVSSVFRFIAFTYTQPQLSIPLSLFFRAGRLRAERAITCVVPGNCTRANAFPRRQESQCGNALVINFQRFSLRFFPFASSHIRRQPKAPSRLLHCRTGRTLSTA